jgi:Pregnancy-associated plasma protein-A/Secretion system C-terminal sorting domain
MRTYFVLFLVFIISSGKLDAQRACSSSSYLQNELSNNPSLSGQISRIETFVKKQIAEKQERNIIAREQRFIIKIPVVVHILYHLPGENISDQKVFSQIEMLNKCFRKTNADTSNTPPIFKSKAADCEIEFQLATSDPKRRSTTGIIHKYTPVAEWKDDDKIKFSIEMGDDAWDAQNYLNIWVGNLKALAGYSSVPGGPLNKDGIVIGNSDFGPGDKQGYELGRTAVHEAGHWLGLKHIWGDAYCGDDLVDDTPKQGDFTSGCPASARTSCSNASLGGDMYMNYMDYTNDACINLFTEGQKARMRALFASGGVRYSILSSYGLNTSLIVEAQLPDEPPKWLYPQLYPNPANNEIILDVAYDTRWVGKTASIFNVNGQLALQMQITYKIQTINISKLKPGLYFLSAKKEDGSYIKQKFIKM